MFYQVGRVARQLVQSPHSKKALGYNLPVSWGLEFACSL